MAYIGNSPYQGSITGGNIVDGSIESIDLATLTNIDINSGSIDGTIIGASSAAAGSFTTLNTTSSVGIGTTSPTEKLQVEGNSATVKITESGGAELRLMATGSTTRVNAYSNHPLLFYTNNTERARIDSSGNLLVGTTDANVGNNSGGTDVGHNLLASGYALHSASGQACLLLNRQASDGEIQVFAKDGTTVGSIGCNGAAIHMASGTTGLRIISDNTIRPSDASGNAKDAAIDLGASGSRFKDLYLSGGVYLGGAGAANHLDDYEEGTFTPVIAGTTTTGTGIYTIQQGKYIKVGNMVYVSIRLGWSAHTGTGNMLLGGLPNLASSTQYSHLGVSFRDGLTISAGHTCHLSVVPNTAYAYIYEISTGTDNAALVAMDIAVTDFTVSGWFTLI